MQVRKFKAPVRPVEKDKVVLEFTPEEFKELLNICDEPVMQKLSFIKTLEDNDPDRKKAEPTEVSPAEIVAVDAVAVAVPDVSADDLGKSG